MPFFINDEINTYKLINIAYEIYFLKKNSDHVKNISYRYKIYLFETSTAGTVDNFKTQRENK